MPAVQTVAQARYASGEAEERPGDEWSHVLRAILDVERYPGLLSASTLAARNCMCSGRKVDRQ